MHRRAMRLRETDLTPLYQLVADYEESGAIENAKAILNRIIELNPKRSLAACRKYGVQVHVWKVNWKERHMKHSISLPDHWVAMAS